MSTTPLIGDHRFLDNSAYLIFFLFSESKHILNLLNEKVLLRTKHNSHALNDTIVHSKRFLACRFGVTIITSIFPFVYLLKFARN